MEHLEGKFQGCKGTNLFYQCWIPGGEIKAILLIVHGLADHSGRFTNLITKYLPEGYAVYGYDQRGHGKSPGLKGYIDKFSCFVDDLDNFLRYIRKKHPDTKIYIIGHSVGGTIATTFALSHQKEFNGLILSGALIKPGASVSKILMTIAARPIPAYSQNRIIYYRCFINKPR